VLGISTVMGLFGVAAAFGLFYLGDRVFHLDHARVQTLMYLKLSVAGHLTIFLTRTRGPFWSIRPARILLIAVFGTQAIATLIAVYGLFMTPLGWGWAAFVWGYALACFLVTDRVKLLAYRVLDHITTETKMKTEPALKPGPTISAKPDAKTVPQSNAKDDSKPKAQASDARPEVRAEPTPEAKSAPQPERPGAKPDSASVLNKTLGDILVAGLLEDPEDAGRLIAAAIAMPAPEAAAGPKPQPEAASKDGAEAPPVSTPRAAE